MFHNGINISLIDSFVFFLEFLPRFSPAGFDLVLARSVSFLSFFSTSLIALRRTIFSPEKDCLGLTFLVV